MLQRFDNFLPNMSHLPEIEPAANGVSARLERHSRGSMRSSGPSPHTPGESLFRSLRLGLPQLHFREGQVLNQLGAHFFVFWFVNGVPEDVCFFQLSFVLA